MKLTQGRIDWPPSVRVESLRRYAFIGDSHAYGMGVAPDQTLAAQAERQMNELFPGWPVECVNLGVSGFNIWNSWVALTQLPQVYDGVVLSLCNNDADLFVRTFHVFYPGPDTPRWESSHPFGQLVTRCFDEIAAFTRERSLPVAVIHHNAHPAQGQLKICEIVRDLCAPRGICFIDTFAHYRERNFAEADLYVSSADFHPSAMAHEAVARHLTATLKRKGWFGETRAREIEAVPDRILTSARAMIDGDRYPPDVALHWAARTMEVKAHLAQRMEAAGETTGGFSESAKRVGQTITANLLRWHSANRTRAIIEDIAAGGHGVVWGLSTLQELKLAFQEIGFALGSGDWSRLVSRVRKDEPSNLFVPSDWPSETAAFLDSCSLDLSSSRDALNELRKLAARTEIGSLHDQPSMLADLEALAQLVDRGCAEFAAARTAFLYLDSAFHEACASLSQEDIALVASLAGGSVQRAKGNCSSLANWNRVIKGIRSVSGTAFTTAEITVSGKSEGTARSIITGYVDYLVPHRLPFTDGGAFWRDGSPAVIKLHFPVFYSARIALRSFIARSVEWVDFTVIKAEFYNLNSRRKIIDPGSFQMDRFGRLVSPVIYLS